MMSEILSNSPSRKSENGFFIPPIWLAKRSLVDLVQSEDSLLSSTKKQTNNQLKEQDHGKQQCQQW